MRPVWWAAAAVAAVIAGAGGLTAVRAGEALAGTTVEGTPVGGLGRADVRATVARLAETRTSGSLVLQAADVRSAVPRELVDVDVEGAVDAALDDRGAPWAALLRRGSALELGTSVDRGRLDAHLDDLAADVDRTPTGGALVVRGLTVTAVPPTPGRRLDRRAAEDTVVRALEVGEPGPADLQVDAVPAPSTPAQVEAVADAARAALGGPYVLGSGALRLGVTPAEVAPLLQLAQLDAGPVLTLDSAALRAVVAVKAAGLAAAPRSARVDVLGRAAVVDTQGDLTWTPRPAQVAVRPATDGRAVDVDAATARLRALVLSADRTGPQPLPVTSVAPPVTTAEASGVRTLLGTFTTYFPAGQPRATNIRRIAQIVDGTWVEPGAVFSLNGTAGPRTRSRGFVADGAIVDGVLTDEVGGGVSQFATTLFNASFFAGLPILQHQPHSFYISRYPAGRESTVYYGAIDVRFRNDTAHPLLVRTRSTAGSVTVELYGDNGGRRVTSTSGPRRPRGDGGFRVDVTRTTTGGDGQGGRRVFRTSYDPAPPA